MSGRVVDDVNVRSRIFDHTDEKHTAAVVTKGSPMKTDVGC